MNRKSLYLQTNGKIMVETEQYKELSRVPRTLSEPNTGASLDLLIESGGTIMHDIIIFAANTQMKDLFGDMWFSIEDFCTVMGYDRTKLQRKLTEEQKASVIAIVFHAGHHENDASDYSATGIGQQKCHGYAVALQDATNGYCQWGVYGTELGCCPTDGSGKKQNNYSAPDIDWSGYAWTQKIITAAGGKDKLNATEDSGYPATYYAVVDYAHKVPSPANSTGWFLPSIGQMWNVYQNRASLFEGKTVVSGLKSDWYWSSSEFCDLPASGALYVSVSGGNVYNYSKDDRNSYVRPVLAF